MTILKVTDNHETIIQGIKEKDISGSEAKILVYLLMKETYEEEVSEHHGGNIQDYLMNEIGLSQHTTCKSLENLESMGVIEQCHES